MRIIVASSNRSHLLDTARELHLCGHEVCFCTYTPLSRLRKYNIPIGICHSVFWQCLLGIVLCRLFPSDFSREILRRLLDGAVSRFVMQQQRIDVFMCQSPHFSKAMKIAKKNATVILDRGSTHVRFYNEQLKHVSARTMREWYMKFDESQYETADYITVPSSFCKRTLTDYGVDNSKLFVNPYGVDLFNFHPTVKPDEDDFDVIYVGGLSKNKGADLLIKVCMKNMWTLLHVGSLIDVTPPSTQYFKHIDSVMEKDLTHYYEKAKVFAMPSYNDGFGLVLIQAAACGLPIVTTKNTGGPDLKAMLNNTPYIMIMDEINEETLSKGIKELLTKADSLPKERKYVDDIADAFSWKAYATRLNQFINKIFDNESTLDY